MVFDDWLKLEDCRALTKGYESLLEMVGTEPFISGTQRAAHFHLFHPVTPITRPAASGNRTRFESGHNPSMFGANLSIFDRVLIVFQLVLSVYVLIRVGIDALGFDDFAKVPPGEWGRLGYLAITIWWVLAAVAATAILIKNRWGWWLQSLVVAPLLVLVCYSLIVTVQEGQRGGYNAKVVMQGILFVFGMASIQFLAIRQALGHWRIKSDRA